MLFNLIILLLKLLELLPSASAFFLLMAVLRNNSDMLVIGIIEIGLIFFIVYSKKNRC